MSDNNTNLILREIDSFKKENRLDHDSIIKQAETTNGTVANLVEWKIQVKTVLWIFGFIIGAVVVPVGVIVLGSFINKQM